MANPSVQQLMDMVKQLLEAQQNAPPAGQQPSNVPSLPNVENFEFGEQSTDIEDWLQQFDFALDCAAPNLQDVLKVKLLMTKLSKEAFAEYKKSCMPKNVTDFDFAKTVEQLKSLFARPQSIWIDRYDCLRASKLEDEEFRAFVNRHKRLLRDFNFKKLKEEQFNCLMLLIAMKSPKGRGPQKANFGKVGSRWWPRSVRQHVPSGVLTTEELLGIYQFNSHPYLFFRGVPGLYSLKFPSHGRIFNWNKARANRRGTLALEIEKVLEFAGEIIGSERKSETVHIGGLPWKIWADIKKKKGSIDNNEKWLSFSLLRDAPKEDENWSCECSSIYRIVSQNSGFADYKRGEFSLTFNNKSNSWGYSNFISFAELMDPCKGLYEKKEDKVTLAIDVTLKEAKMADNS
ncbi:hypothetical protein niasHT_013891 [Heterodera trifolii]|uniref:MATH domain-containing protein n=1 Tax=Heterodera trifolii TaxID=157864 RepID=A0ABD2KTU5_9BILA